MKNILLGLIFMLVFLPQVSFGATACDQKLDAESVAFFQQQGQDRGAFINANPDLIAKQDRRGRWMMIHKNDHPGSIAYSGPQDDLTPQEESAFATFVQKQQSDRHVFLEKLDQEKQNNCLNP